MMIIAVASAKGGTGKSTVTLNLAGMLSALHHKVLVVDADRQGSIARWDAVRTQEEPDVLVAPSPVTEKKIRKHGKNHDIVLFDAPPTFKKSMKSVVRSADRLIIPVTPGYADLWSTEKFLDVYRREKEKRPGLDGRLLISRVDRRTKQGREFRSLLTTLNIPVFITEIPQRVVFADTWAHAMTVDRLQPRGQGSHEFRKLAEEVLLWIRPYF